MSQLIEIPVKVLGFISFCQWHSATEVHYFPIWCFKHSTEEITDRESAFGTHKLDYITSQSLYWDPDNRSDRRALLKAKS